MGSKHGRFEMVYPSGDKYKGDFRSGQRHGRGVYESAKGEKYEGMWVDDMRHGFGVLTFTKTDKTGSKWAGTYEGEWIKDLKHGKGTFSYANGDKYEGQWVKGKKTGRGVYSYANGDKYDGEFLEDDMHGRGTWYSANGDRLDGVWEHDILNGRYVLTVPAQRRKFEQIYAKGELVTQTLLPDEPEPESASSSASSAKPVAKEGADGVDDLMNEVKRQRSKPSEGNGVDAAEKKDKQRSAPAKRDVTQDDFEDEEPKQLVQNRPSAAAAAGAQDSDEMTTVET